MKNNTLTPVRDGENVMMLDISAEAGWRGRSVKQCDAGAALVYQPEF